MTKVNRATKSRNLETKCILIVVLEDKWVKAIKFRAACFHQEDKSSMVLKIRPNLLEYANLPQRIITKEEVRKPTH